MKKLLVAIVISSGLVQRANAKIEYPALRCKLVFSYLSLKSDIVIDPSENGIHVTQLRGNDLVQYSWSDSECEDSTIVKFEIEDLKRLADGTKSKIAGSFLHEEPDVKIQATLNCVLN